MLRIAVCKKCGSADKDVRRELKRARKKYGKGIEVVEKGCLDACKKAPSVRVGKKLIAPATKKRIRKAVRKRIDAAS